MTAKPHHILVIDDEPAIKSLLKVNLAEEGYEVDEAAGGKNGLIQFERQKPDLVLLDFSSADCDGREIIRQIRIQGLTPVIVLSIRNDEHSKVETLDLGADDYLVKPFGINELNARIRVALRHRLQQAGAKPVFKTGDLIVDLVSRNVSRKGAEIKLSPKEYDLQQLLILNAGNVLTHRMIMREIWDSTTNVQYFRIYIRHLRHKLEVDPIKPALILTEASVGYRLNAAL